MSPLKPFGNLLWNSLMNFHHLLNTSLCPALIHSKQKMQLRDSEISNSTPVNILPHLDGLQIGAELSFTRRKNVMEWLLGKSLRNPFPLEICKGNEPRESGDKFTQALSVKLGYNQQKPTNHRILQEMTFAFEISEYFQSSDQLSIENCEYIQFQKCLLVSSSTWCL